MARAIRLIWRLDFEVSFSYLDRRGAALNALINTVEGFWDQVGEGKIPISYAGSAIEPHTYRTISLEPTCLNGSMEWPEGIPLDRLFDDAVFRNVDRIVRAVLKLGEIRVMTRAGVRIFCVENFEKKTDQSALERIGGLIDLDFQQATVEAMGEVDDFAMIVEGKTPDGLGYRTQFGPYAAKNPQMVFVHSWTSDLTEALDKSDLFFDIDLFENNISFSEHSLYRWASTKIAKAREFVDVCSKKIT
jgi:hypothetical protein